MGINYSQCEVALLEIAQRNVSNKNRMDQARATVATADADLGAMGTLYAPIIDTINAAAVAYPENAAYQAVKARADALVADYVALKAESAALKTAIGA